MVVKWSFHWEPLITGTFETEKVSRVWNYILYYILWLCLWVGSAGEEKRARMNQLLDRFATCLGKKLKLITQDFLGCYLLLPLLTVWGYFGLGLWSCRFYTVSTVNQKLGAFSMTALFWNRAMSGKHTEPQCHYPTLYIVYIVASQ